MCHFVVRFLLLNLHIDQSISVGYISKHVGLHILYILTERNFPRDLARPQDFNTVPSITQSSVSSESSDLEELIYIVKDNVAGMKLEEYVSISLHVSYYFE